jgi:hypothetical protein
VAQPRGQTAAITVTKLLNPARQRTDRADFPATNRAARTENGRSGNHVDSDHKAPRHHRRFARTLRAEATIPDRADDVVWALHQCRQFERRTDPGMPMSALSKSKH